MKTDDKRIKECIVCGEVFRDNTRPNNKKACSPECADEARKARQRKQYRIENPKKPTQREIYYYEHLEYPFWLDEQIGNHQEWGICIPYSPEKVDYIIGARQVDSLMGGKQSKQYNGGDDLGGHKVSVKFVEHNREPGEVITYTLTPKELSEYLEKLGCRKSYR